MMDLQSSPVSFTSPPVVETGMAIQFSELRDFKAVHFGHFHTVIRDRFPVAEDHQRAEPIHEQFPKVARELTLQLVKKRGTERVWYRDRDNGSLLLQLQPDRFGLNWRRNSDDEAYPSFSKNGNIFLKEFGGFKDFCNRVDLDQPSPNLCEVIYINHILPKADETAIECFGSIFSGLRWELSDDWLSAPELVTFNRVYEIGVRQGRLYAEAGIAHHPEHGDFVLLKMTARVLVNEGSDVASSLQTAHDHIVNGFASITTEEAQSLRWGRRP